MAKNERLTYCYFNNEHGAVLILSLMMLLMLSLLATTVTMLTTTDIKISNNYKMSKEAFFAAEAGIEIGRDELLKVIRVNDKAWIDVLSQNSDNDSASPTWETFYGLSNYGGTNRTWDTTTPLSDSINTDFTNRNVTGASGPTFSLRIKDNDDQDNNYTLDTDYIVILESTGSLDPSQSLSKTIEVIVSCPTCEDFYAQERYSPENPGSIQTQSGTVTQLRQATFN